MNIGIDIDDTMSNSFEIMLADSQIYDIEEMKGTGDIKNLGSIPTYDQIENMYKWEEKALKKFWYKHFERVLREATPKQYVAETIKKLKEEGNNIYIITARYEQDGIESVEGLTEEWLKKNKIEYDRLLINSSDKLKIAREYNIDVFIDDCFKFCKEINDSGIKSYMFVGTTNNNIETGEVEKVYSWPQVYFKIKEFTQKTQ